MASELEALRRLSNEALSRVTMEWNLLHDLFRLLPIELVEYCWSFLDTRELVKAAAVRRGWRSMLLDAQALWSNLDFHAGDAAHYQQLDALLQRSGGLKLCLSVDLRGPFYQHQYQLSTVLQGHAHRLYRLDFHALPSSSEPLVLDFEAPILHSLSTGNLAFVFDALVFRGHCPALQFVRLANPPIISIADDMLFSGVRSLAFNSGEWPLTFLFTAFPHRERLEINFNGRPWTWPGSPPDLPRHVPLPTTLQHVVLEGISVSYQDICDFGFTRLRQLDVKGHTFDQALELFFQFGGDVHMASVQGTLVTLGSVTDPVPLVLLPDTPWAQEYPALRTLILPLDYNDKDHPLFNLQAMEGCGTLCAPNLRRLVISHVPDNFGRPIDPVSPANLALFIAHHLVLAPGRILDEIVLEQGHIMLEQNEDWCDHDREILESYVGTPLMMSMPLIQALA
ncbi:hypothetical protein AURDEDRAFT_170618 [Auricularia subglabra TFB-10046 SS5]|nr:hypothetical protein AURDEDRAFT_170618 [Auricularia subglabra TFB-10046 SS5]